MALAGGLCLPECSQGADPAQPMRYLGWWYLGRHPLATEEIQWHRVLASLSVDVGTGGGFLCGGWEPGVGGAHALRALRCSGDALGAFWAMQVMLCPLQAGAFHEWDTRSISRTTWAVVSSVVWEFFVLGFWRMEPVWPAGSAVGLPTEHPCTRVILTRLVPKFAVAVDFLI